MGESRRISEWMDSPLDIGRLAIETGIELAGAAQRFADSRSHQCDVRLSPDLLAGSFAAVDKLRINGTAPDSWGAMSGFYEVEDGWVRVHANYPHHASALQSLFDASDVRALRDALRSLTRFEAESSILSHGGVAAAVRMREEWESHHQGRAASASPWRKSSITGQKCQFSERSKRARPANGIRVLDLTRVIAGPTCSQLLACFGADVLRIDPPHIPELQNQYVSNAMGKRSAVLDLAASQSKLSSLLSDADVVLLGYSPGSLHRFGLSPEQLERDYPHLIIGCLSAWGWSGPWMNHAGFDSIVQAASGIAAECGAPPGSSGAPGAIKPGALPVQALDHSSGLLLAAGLLDLLSQKLSGRVEVSLIGAAERLFSYPRVAVGEPATTSRDASLTIPCAYGLVTIPPPPVLLNGNYLTGKILRYGESRPEWQNMGLLHV